MGLWVEALCPQGVGDLTAAFLQEALREAAAERLGEALCPDRLATFLETIQVSEAASFRLTAEGQPEVREPVPGEFRDMALDYVHPEHGENRVEFTRTTGAEAAADLCSQLANLPPGKIRTIVESVTDLVSFPLKLGHQRDLGWDLCLQLARTIALHGRGIVRAEGDWIDPEPA